MTDQSVQMNKLLSEVDTVIGDAITAITKSLETLQQLKENTMPANFIIARDMPAEFGESPALFNAERFEEYCRTYGEPEYETEVVTLDDVIDWLDAMDKEGQNFILIIAEIPDHEYRYITAAL
jgi:orotate phosphoribosyltransferase